MTFLAPCGTCPTFQLPVSEAWSSLDLSSYLRLLAFLSIFIAVMVTMIALGVKGPGQGMKLYSLWPKEGLTFQEAFLSVSNIMFAYGTL